MTCAPQRSPASCPRRPAASGRPRSGSRESGEGKTGEMREERAGRGSGEVEKGRADGTGRGIWRLILTGKALYSVMVAE